MGYSITYDSTSVSFTVEYEAGFSQYRVFIREGGLSDTGKTIMDATYDATATFTEICSGLTPKTVYTINCRTVGDGSAGWMGPTEFTTKSDGGEGRPEDWAWTTNIVKGATVPLSSYGYLAPVSAVEWNGFCARINEFRTYAGLDEYTFTTVSSNYPITWAVVNEVKTAIGGILGSGALPTSTNPIEAAFYIQLAAALNAVP